MAPATADQMLAELAQACAAAEDAETLLEATVPLLVRLIGAGSAAADVQEAVAVRKRQRIEEHRLDDAEDGGVRADGEREREDDGERETGSPDQAARGMPEVPAPFVEGGHLMRPFSGRVPPPSTRRKDTLFLKVL